MKILVGLIVISGCLGVSASAQTARVFDNFDTAAGVQVIKPPVPEIARTTRKLRNGKWVVVAEDKLVKKTVQTSRVGATVAVSDSLALREPLPAAAMSKLSMGSNSFLKGFTTGNPVVDSYIVDSSRRYNI